ncbi:DUF4394 domain-containing protein [Sandarakinorhabdus rubra]|uniref:DUF4394 domain-containing protein n=1 Tax=Sandarakinorhabdus rubra TaxID=2672568 RepID=UPI0013DC3B7A|nr:DUF4394 domain-containing protein [Sandarakinorhabdus rubra]
MFKRIAGRLRAAVLAAAVMAPAAHADTIYGLTADNRIVSFDASAPGSILSDRAISGLAAGDSLLGIDRRPVDRLLYALGSSGNVYRLEATGRSYTATNLGAVSAALTGTSFGFDFNPTVDRLRVVSDANQNLRINTNVSPPGTISDGALTLNGQSPFDLLAVAYTNSIAGATSTRLFGIDARTGALVRSTNANAGTYVSTDLSGMAYAPLGFALDNSQMLGFDIAPRSGLGYFNVGSSLYGIDLASGSPTLLGSIGSGGLVGLSAGAVPEPESWALMIAGFGLVGASLRRTRMVRAAA